MKKVEMNKLIIAAFSGAATGTILALLFAPEKGAATRENISKSGDKYLKKIKNELKRLSEQVNKQAQTTKESLQEFGENAKGKGKEIYKSTKKLTSYNEWTKEELYNHAKQNGIEGYSKMNKDELIQALMNQ